MRRGYTVAAAALVCGFVAWPASATYPGRDGRIFFPAQFGSGTELASSLPDGLDLRRLTSGYSVVSDPAVSPDGTRVAFVSTRGGSGAEIYVVSARGGRPRRLTHNHVRDSWPTWSPDGTRIALARGGARFESRIFVMNANGTHPRMLTRGGLDVQPAWSPDGTRIAFVRRISSCDPGGELVVTTLRDGRETALACGVSAPAWSPDAKRIGASHETDCRTFVTTPPCYDLLIVTPAKGTTSERELPGLGDAVGPRWSPDGKEVTVGGDWQPLCTHSGTRRAQLLLGTSKTDVICGFGGNDLIDGNAGHDVLYGGVGNDLIIDQSGRDWLFGGPGRDRLRARDGAADIIDCGPGRDIAIVDRRDVVSHCEVVRRG